MPSIASRSAAVALAAGLLVSFAAVQAAERYGRGIDINVGQVSVVQLPRPAKDVVLGNPAVADVTVQSPTTVAVFGRKPGGTSLTISDASDRPMLEAMVVVGGGGPGTVSVTAAAAKENKPANYACGGFTCVRMDDAAIMAPPAGR